MKAHTARIAVLGIAIASGFAVSSMAAANAGQNASGDPVVTASGETAESAALATRMSEAGYLAMRAITGARIAIFNDKPELAKQLVDSAAAYLDVVARDDTEYVASKGISTSSSADNKLVPIDGSVVVADSYVSTPERDQKLAQANAQLKSGDSKKAMETLKLASIDVSMRRILMPVGLTIGDVAAARELLGNNQFYEANLALKAAVDRLVVDTIDDFRPE